MSFAERLKTLRIQKGITQKDMAKLLRMNSYTAYQKYELNVTMPSLDKLITISNILNVSIDYLLCQTDNPKRNE